MTRNVYYCQDVIHGKFEDLHESCNPDVQRGFLDGVFVDRTSVYQPFG